MTVSRSIDYQQLLAWRRSHPAWRLLQADHAPMIASFLHQSFVLTSARGVPREYLASQLDDHLFRLHEDAGERLFPKAATAYLDDWASDARGWLRKYYPTGVDEPHYDLTPASVLALRWMRRLDERACVGTEARFTTMRRLLHEIADGAELNPRARIDRLRERKAEIDAEIARIEQGRLELLEPVQIRERFSMATDIAGDLLFDLRALEQNFRNGARAFHEQLASCSGPVEPSASPCNPIEESDEGSSFQAFRKLLASPSGQAELIALLEKAASLDPVRAMAAAGSVHRLPHDLVDAVEATFDTASRISQQLRRQLDDRARLENRRIMHLLRGIEQKALALRLNPPEGACSGIDEPSPTLALPMERPLFRPPFKPRIRQATVLDAGQDEIPADPLFARAPVDPLSLASNVRQALQTRKQISLAEVVAISPIRHGLAELAAYLELAAHDLHSAIDEERSEVIRWADQGGKVRQASMPLVIYTLGVS
jgi:hypothetical protein